MSSEPIRSIYVVYDGECPFCASYVQMVRLRDAIGNVQLINARDQHEIVEYVKARGIDLDQEMALVIDGRIYSGADCVNQIALMSTGSGLLNRINGAIFSSPTASRVLYPWMRAGRNLALRLLGRRSIKAGGVGASSA